MQNVNTKIEKSNTLPGTFYYSDENFENVKLKIFEKTWQFIDSSCSFKENNFAKPFFLLDDFIDEPLFLIVNNNKFSCFSNVCTHRGNILLEVPAIIKNKIVCGYHGKQFNTCGKFSFMPKTEGMLNFPSDVDNLSSIDLSKWNKFIFVSIDPIIPFNLVIQDMSKRISWLPVEDFNFRKDLSKEYSIDANWALYCDNYLEGFHIPFIHNDLNEALDFNNYDVELFKYSNLQIGIGKNGEDCFDIPETSIDFGKNIAAYYFWLFPNMMFNFYPWGLSINIVKPISPTKTKVEFLSYVWKQDKMNIGAGADINKVELEDEEIVQRVQKGVKSRYYKNGRFSPSMEQGVHHFHLLIKEFLFK